MIVNCPKCGFSQPQDQYCASCGVDMIAYRPKPPSFARRLFSNTVFQMTLVSLLIFAVFAYVREQDHKDHMARLELARKADQFATTSRPESDFNEDTASVGDAAIPTEPSSADIALSKDPAEPNPGPSLAPSQPGTTVVVGASATSPTPSTSNAAGSAAGATNTKPADSVRISFIEVQRPLIAELLSSAAQLAIAGTLSAGVVPGIQARLATARTERTWRNLDSSAFQEMRLNQPTMIFKGTRDPASGQNLGFTIQVLPTLHEEQTTTVQVDILRVLREPAGNLEETTLPLPDAFNIPKGGALMISGVLPHRALAEAEERLYRSASVLRVMASEAFRTGQTEAVIVIETK